MNDPNSARNGITPTMAAARRKGVTSVFVSGGVGRWGGDSDGGMVGGGDGGGGAAVMAFPRPLPGTIPGNISSSVCKISEFHVALFRYVTHVPPPPPTASPTTILIALVSRQYSRFASRSLPLYRPLVRTWVYADADTQGGVTERPRRENLALEQKTFGKSVFESVLLCTDM